jgi:hypothetical protein
MKNQRLPVQFWFLMMGGLLPETCWASYKYWVIKFDTLLHIVGSFFEFYYDAQSHERQVNTKYFFIYPRQFIIHKFFLFSFPYV